MAGDKHTPVPNSILFDLTNDIGELKGQVKQGFGGVSERLQSLEEQPPHACLREEELSTLITDAAAQKEKVKGLASWRTYVMGFVAIVLGAVITFVVTSSTSDAVAQSERGTMRGDIDENKDSIKVLERGLTHRTAIIEESLSKRTDKVVQEVQAAVKNGNGHDVLITDEELKRLRPYEQRMLKRLIEEAKNGD